MARLGKAPLLTAAGGALIAISTFLPWYPLYRGWTFYAPLDEAAPPSVNKPYGHLNAWESFSFADILLMAAAVAALAGAALAGRIRGGWGWLATGGVGVAAGAGTLYAVNHPSAEFALAATARPAIGYFVALVGAALIAGGGLIGVAVAERAAPPPP
jgi:hypothetical protein